MKVCLIIEKDYPHTGTSREIHTLLSLGYNVTLICRTEEDNKKPSYEKNGNFEIIRVKSKPSERFSFFKNIKKIKEEHNKVVEKAVKLNPDVIHCHGHMMWHGAKIKKLLKKPLIFDMRENYPDMVWYSRSDRPFYLIFLVLFLKFAERWGCRKADNILVVVEESKERLVNLGADGKKITTIMNSEIPENYSKDKIDNDLEKRLNNKFSDDILISYIGNLGPHRGLKTAIEAMEIVVKKMPNVKLMIVGGDNNFDDLNNLRKKLNLEENVILTGRKPHGSLPTYLAVTDIGLIPHRSNPHVESTIPNKIFQNMLMGKPQIVSDVKPLKRIINETKSGLVFKAEDPISLAKTIIKLAEDEELRKKLGKNGRKAAIKEYNWNVEGEKLSSLYKQLEKQKKS